MVQININEIMKKAVAVIMSDKKVEDVVRKRALDKMRSAKEKLLDNFDNHLVTQEIDAGADVRSRFLPRGNLFSFIGFSSDDKPTDNIRFVLKDKIRLTYFPQKRVKSKNSVEFKFIVQQPLLSDIWSVTPFTDGWKSGSWADDLETRGISHFEYYVFDFAFKGNPNSRSGTGLQKPTKVNSSSAGGGIPYIRQLMKEFARSFK